MRAGGSHHAAAFRCCKRARGQYQIIGRNACDRRNVLGRERRDRGFQRIDANGIGGHKLGVIKLFRQDHPQDSGQNARVLSRLRRDVQEGVGGGFGGARIDHDQLHAVLHRLLHGLAGIDHYALLGNDRIGADHDPRFRAGKRLRTGNPATVQRLRDHLARLIDGLDRKEPVRERAHRHDEHRADHRVDRVGQVTVAGIDRDGLRPVLGHDGFDALGDFLHRLRHRNFGVGAVRHPLAGMEHTRRRIMRIGHGAALGAGIAAIDRRLAITDHLGRAAILDRHLDRAACPADLADAETRFARRGVVCGHAILAPGSMLAGPAIDTAASH